MAQYSLNKFLVVGKGDKNIYVRSDNGHLSHIISILNLVSIGVEDYNLKISKRLSRGAGANRIIVLDFSTNQEALLALDKLQAQIDYLRLHYPTGDDEEPNVIDKVVPIGSQGFQGFTGSQGFQGIDGSIGIDGNQGFQGFTGSQGFQGIDGSIGIDGNQGFQGFIGSQGFQGIDGSIGIDGNQGFQGFIGSQGSQGIDGSIGIDGNQGFQGFIGSQGSQGIDGSIGIDGNQGFQGPSNASSSTQSSIFIPTPQIQIRSSWNRKQFKKQGTNQYDYDNSLLYDSVSGVWNPFSPTYSNDFPVIYLYFTGGNEFLNYNPVVEIGYYNKSANKNASKIARKFVHPPHQNGSTHLGRNTRSGTPRLKHVFGRRNTVYLDLPPFDTEWNFTPVKAYEKQSITVPIDGLIANYIVINDSSVETILPQFPIYGVPIHNSAYVTPLSFKGKNRTGKILISFRIRIEGLNNEYIVSDWSKSILVDINYERLHVYGSAFDGSRIFISTGWRARLLEILYR